MKISDLDGHHETGHNDGVVTFLTNYGSSKLKTLSQILCQKFPNLVGIQISSAKMESINENSLLKCENLEYLARSANKIREFPEILLSKNSKLYNFNAMEN